MPRQRLHVRHGAGAALLHDAHRPAVAVALPQIVAHPQDRPLERRQQRRKLRLQIPLQIAVQRRKRLIQQNSLRLGAQDAGQRHPLLLPAGQLDRVLFLQPLQPEQPQLLRQHTALLRPVAGADAAQDVLLHRHGGEQGILLEQIPHPPLLGRQIDVLLAVEQHPVAQHDAPPVRRDDTGNALEGHALAAAGGAQQRHGLIRRLELRPEVERPQPLLDVHIQAHFAALLPPTVRKSRFSSMFTASSTTAEIADHHVITSRMPKVSSTHAPMSRFGPRTRRMR